MWAPSVRHLRLFKYTQTTTGQNAITTKSNPVQELHVEFEFDHIPYISNVFYRSNVAARAEMRYAGSELKTNYTDLRSRAESLDRMPGGLATFQPSSPRRLISDSRDFLCGADVANHESA